MLASMGQKAQDDRMPLFSAYVNKPVKASQLYNTLIEVLAGDVAILARRTGAGELSCHAHWRTRDLGTWPGRRATIDV